MPVPVLLDGAIESAKESSKMAKYQNLAQEKNQQQLEADYNAYREKADAGDPASQLNMSRVLYRQVYLYTTNPDFVDTEVTYLPDEKSKEKMSPVREKADRYLELSMNQGYAPALTYFECKEQAKDGGAWEPSDKDISILGRAAAAGDLRAKFFLAQYVYMFGIRSQNLSANKTTAYRLLLDAYTGGDTAATIEVATMGNPEIFPPEVVKESKTAMARRREYLGKGKLDPCSYDYRN